MVNKVTYIEFEIIHKKFKINPNHIVSISNWKNKYNKYWVVQITTVNSVLDFKFDYSDPIEDEKAEKESIEFIKLFE